MKKYQTNRFKSVMFYMSILLPILIIFVTLLDISNIKSYWPALIFFYIFMIPLEFFFIKYRQTSITIDDNGIIIKNSNLQYKTRWPDIVKLEESLFGQGEFFYQLITKDKKILPFSSSIENCDDLIKEIETHTGLKFKQRL